jgi:predicted homoserine dehydrogenase-like protein
MLERLKALTSPIRVGIVGAGAMGRGLARQCRITPGFECVAVADVDPNTLDGLRRIGEPCLEVSSVREARAALRSGELPFFTDGLRVCELPEVDVVIEASSAVAAGGRHALTALEHGKHLVLMNSEVDLIFGPALLRLATENGVVYTSCDGDQHGVIKRLLDEVSLWGFRPVMAGNIKGFLDRCANPTTIVPEADKRRLSYRMCTAYTDGTKLSIEMALVANAEGLRTHVPGMLGPAAAAVEEVVELFDFDAIWDGRQGLVDYVLGARPGGGVFVVGFDDNAYQREMLDYYKLGSGPFYVFYRPFHICHVEAMRSVAEAVLDGRALLAPRHGFLTNVVAYAKADLRAGDTCDGIGGYACYGQIENCGPDGRTDGLPICLAEDVVLTRDIPKHARIDLANVELPSGRFDHELYERALTA